MLLPSTYYHIYNHANGDDNLFREERNYPFFLEKYRYYIDPIADTIAWCLMPNHFHLLVRIKDVEDLVKTFPKFGTLEKFGEGATLENLSGSEKEKQLSFLLSKQFSNLFSSYTQAFNKVYQRKGSLFLKNFKRKAIHNDAYLQRLILYIHLNPVKHGFTTEITGWLHSSYSEFWEKQTALASQLFGDKDQVEKIHFEKQSYFKEYTAIENHLLT